MPEPKTLMSPHLSVHRMKKSCFSSLLVGSLFVWLVACQSARKPSQTTDAEAEAWENAEPIPSSDLVFDTPKANTAPAWVVNKADYNPEPSRPFDLIHTLLRVSFDWEKQWLLGEAELTITPHFYPQNEVVLDAKRMQIHEVLIGEKKADLAAADYSHHEELLRIGLPTEAKAGDTLRLQIRYTAKPNASPAGGSAAITADKGLYFVNPLGKIPGVPRQIWTQGETEASSCWFPTFDQPNAKTTQELFITVADTLTTLSNGLLVRSYTDEPGMRTDHWRQDLPHTPYLFTMAIGSFAKVSDQWNGKAVDYYVEPAFAPYARDVFGRTPQMMTFFSERFGVEYPWDKYAQVVVREFVSGAMENTSASTFMSGLHVDRRHLLDRNWDNIIAHELSHHWFGNLVTCESWANLPLNESFANYAEYLWQEHYYGEDAAAELWLDEQTQYMSEAMIKRVPMIRYHYHHREDMFDRHSYSKGCLILHLLRQYTGDEAFFAALTRYLQGRAYQTAEIDHLRLAVEEVTGQDWHWFFDQFFMQPGHPEWMLKHSYDAESQVVELDLYQRQPGEYVPIYQLPLTVRLWIDGQPIDHQIMLTDASQQFRIPAPKQPDLVILDPKGGLFGKVEHLKTIEEFVYQYHHAERFIHRLTALQELSSEAQDPNYLPIFLAALDSPQVRLRMVALMALAEFADAESWEKPVLELAKNDPESQVRAKALSMIAALGKPDPALLNRALADSSYKVIATALWQYESLGGTALEQTLEHYEHLHDRSIVSTLTSLFIKKRIIGKTDWMLEQLAYQDGWQLAGYLGSMSQYLQLQSQADQLRAIPTIAAYAQHSGNGQVRSSAFRLLSQFAGLGDVRSQMDKIRDAEQDPEVRKAMERY